MQYSRTLVWAGMWGLGIGLALTALVGAEELSKFGPTAFRLHRDGMNSAQMADFNYGRGLFHHIWVPVEYGDGSSSGLGPLYNSNSCAGCHIRDGRGHPLEEGVTDSTSFVLRLSAGVIDINGYKQVLPEPTYGFQFQTHGILDHVAEGLVRVRYEESKVELSGGKVIFLRQPDYELTQLGYGTMSENVMLGPRVAPQLIGLGFLENIPVSRLRQLEDVADSDGDGISGRINWALPGINGERLPGRFGWKSTTVSVRQQSELAANGDMGISTPNITSFWGDCTATQLYCRQSTRAEQFGKDVELAEREIHLLAFYAANLIVPDRRNVGDPDVALGEKMFKQIGCAACHVPSHTLESGQVISPFTDLLLHDLGEGLADGIEVGYASKSEWRTAPLWGIGMTRIVSGHTFFLHDGRARNLTEAILWHGGEAFEAQNRFVEMPEKDRDSLLAFLNSL